MNTRYYMVIIKGEIKTSEIMSCGYNRNTQKWDVKFNNGKTYSYAYLNVEKLTDPEVLNPNMYRISREGREFFDVNAIYVFRSGSESYWHICFGNGSERNYRRNDLHIIESCLAQSQSSNVFEYIKQIAGLSNLKNEETGEKLLSKKFDKISFVGSDVALAKYLNPSSLQGKRTGREYIPIFPFGCNNSQYKAVKNAMENQISVIQGPPGTGKTQTILNIIANILMQGKTVQIVSNNNSATENVYEKLSSPKYNLGFIAATLGSSKNKKTFVLDTNVILHDYRSIYNFEDNDIVIPITVLNRLQIRIVKATQQKDYNAVKRLQYLLTHSFYAKALAVKRVVTNDGRRTPGVDGVLWNTPAKKMAAALSLTDKRYRARPLRRVYIEKKDKKKKRPLGIPTMYDRAMQALYALALEPVAETTADGKSFGFRKGRCAQDACEYLFNALSRKHISPKWVLEGDIKGCFDHISHDWLLANIPMDKNILKQFLKAGFIYQRELFPTEEGTPQGGIISPILANMTLDGIEKKLVERFHTNALGKVDSRFKNAHKVNFVRYADDFVVTAATPELALEAKELIREFLAERGLELSDEKTVVTNIDDGFDFLGWNFRKYNEKLIIKPSKKAVKAIVSNISDTILRRGKAWQQDVLIMKLNEQIRGWTNYHQSVCASDAFAHLDYVLYELLWRWAKRRHPKKNKWWISMRYWHRVGNRNWVFSTENKELIRVDSTAIVRHTKIKATANPFLDEAYFQKRKFDKGMHRLTGKFKTIWKNQNGLCYHCGMPMDVTEEREIFYLAPKAKTGVEDVRNMRYVHCACQRIYAENRLKK